MTRVGLIALRRELIEKITKTLPHSKLFKEGIIYPRRYFDDLVVEQRNKEITMVDKRLSTEKKA